MAFLKGNNYKILEKNYFYKHCEIDIIAEKEEEIIFVEVKTRTNNKFGSPRDSVNFYKKKNIKMAAKYFLYVNRLYNSFIRFDLIEVYCRNERVYINHIKDII